MKKKTPKKPVNKPHVPLTSAEFMDSLQDAKVVGFEVHAYGGTAFSVQLRREGFVNDIIITASHVNFDQYSSSPCLAFYRTDK